MKSSTRVFINGREVPGVTLVTRHHVGPHGAGRLDIETRQRSRQIWPGDAPETTSYQPRVDHEGRICALVDRVADLEERLEEERRIRLGMLSQTFERVAYGTGRKVWS